MPRRINMIATARLKVEGRQLYPGMPFTVDTESEARDLEAIHFARRDSLKDAPVKRGRGRSKVNTYLRRDLEAESNDA